MAPFSITFKNTQCSHRDTLLEWLSIPGRAEHHQSLWGLRLGWRLCRNKTFSTSICWALHCRQWIFRGRSSGPGEINPTATTVPRFSQLCQRQAQVRSTFADHTGNSQRLQVAADSSAGLPVGTWKLGCQELLCLQCNSAVQPSLDDIAACSCFLPQALPETKLQHPQILVIFDCALPFLLCPHSQEQTSPILI